MLTLPPAERPHLMTGHLVAPQEGWSFSRELLQKLTSKGLPTGTWHVSPLLTFGAGTGVSAAVLTLGFFVFLQPHPPALAQASRDQVAQEVASAKAPSTLAQAQKEETPAQAELVAANPSPSPVAADLVASLSTPEEKVYAYHLALAQGFLRKAVELSQQTKELQNEETKKNILSSLEQALQAANKAIESDARQGAGFLVRARIYKTAAAVKPELSTQSDQDLTIAKALGINAALFGNDTSLLEYLPTQQATNLAGAPVVADAEEGNQTQVSDSSTGNGTQGRVTLPAGSTTVSVSLPTLKSTQSLRVNPADPAANRTNALFSITQRVDGQGFTIQSSQTLSSNLELEWRAIDE